MLLDSEEVTKFANLDVSRKILSIKVLELLVILVGK
jgi:hypothetical protein